MEESIFKPQDNPTHEEMGTSQASIIEGSAKIENGVLMIGNKSLQNLLDELEKRLEDKRLKLIYELEDQLNITLPKI